MKSKKVVIFILQETIIFICSKVYDIKYGKYRVLNNDMGIFKFRKKKTC